MVEVRDPGVLDPRQLWNPLTTPTRTQHRYCTPFTLPSNGVLSFGDTAITLTTNARFVPECTGEPTADVSLASAMKDPFYASTIPQTYVISATTIIAWILVVMLVITPRTNFLGQTSTSAGISRGHGVIGGSTGGNINIIGVGSRPWLQKLAAFSVAVALTIATADMFREAHAQYTDGYIDANRLREFVLGSQEIRIARVISDVVVWLAQVQTLVRLFPRHKEKVLIKWIGFCLIIFDTVFSCVNAFYIDEGSPTRPRRFVNAIPALSYLFELSLGLLYAAWVIYYAISKRRYAFYHPQMRSIIVIAVLSIIAVCTPVVFFVIDVSNPDVAGWGDYFRWVGAAAASVVVWEWVERIEALERDEKKDGILGREVFDGDEMLDLMPTDQIVWNSGRSRRYRRGGGGDGSSTGRNLSTADYDDASTSIFASKFRRRQKRNKQQQRRDRHGSSETGSNATHNQNGVAVTRVPFAETSPNTSSDREIGHTGITRPAPVASPVNRGDTSSAGSTVYVIKYDTTADAPQPIRRRVDANGNGERARAQIAAQRSQMAKETIEEEEEEQPTVHRDQSLWHAVPNPFKRKRASPPTEVQKAKEAAAAANGDQAGPTSNTSRRNFKNKINALSSHAGERNVERNARQPDDADDPVIVIPAQHRRGSVRPTPTTTTTAQRTIPPMSGRAAVEHDSSGSSNAQTTLTGRRERPRRTLSPPSASLQQVGFRTNNTSPLGAGGAISNGTTPSHTNLAGRPVATRRPTFSQPPRADDISPAAGSTGPTVIPAPRRSPAKTGTPSADGSSALGNSAGGRADT